MARLVLLPRIELRDLPAREAVGRAWRATTGLLWRLNATPLPHELHGSDIEQSLRVTYG